MKRVEVDIKVKMIIDIQDNVNIDDVVNEIEISEFEISEHSKIVAANITERKSSNFLKL